MLRPYQQSAVNAATAWMTKTVEPCVIEAATGAGKSHVIAALAEWVFNKTKSRVLCLAPSKELTEQNYQKYLLTGNPASIYSASIKKCLRHNVVFGTPVTVLNKIDAIANNFNFSCVVIDECHGITPTIKKIIETLKSKNKHLRVIGLTATPYRLTSGYIYKYDIDNNPISDDKTIEPYFNKLVYSIGAHELISMGFLTPPHADPSHADSYDTSLLKLNKMGKYDSVEVEKAFEGKGRKTSLIVADIVAHSINKCGVMIFAATVSHAHEIMDSLPPELSSIVTGNTKKTEREQIINKFKQQKIKYIVNVSVLTTGFDASHVDVIAILRATESVGLLQQIVGRGLRLHEGKTACLILDYAGNLERHCPGGDLFDPEIKAKRKGAGGYINATCESCGCDNQFKARVNDSDFEIDQAGYFIDLHGERIKTDDGIDLPAHFGRRCMGQIFIAGISKRCDQRWSFKECPECGADNDIAARYCEKCRAEIVDPNEKLKLEFKRIKSDPYSCSTDKVLSWDPQLWHSQSGNKTVRIDYTTEYASFSIWYMPNSNIPTARRAWHDLNMAVYGRVAPDAETFIKYLDKGKMPETITAHRERGSKFWRVFAHNQVEDKQPNEAA